MSTDEITARVQQLINNRDLGHGGIIGEAIVEALPGMQKCHRHSIYDFNFVPAQSRIEVKWGKPVAIPSAGGKTYQARWYYIRPYCFNYLILSTFHECNLHLWLLPSLTAAGFITPSMGGTIRQTLPPFYRTRTVKAERLDYYRITFDQLHSRCLNGALDAQP
jgi:hypothetical protein